MGQRKKDISQLKGNHGADRTGEIKPEFSEMEFRTPSMLGSSAKKVFRELCPLLSKGGALKATDYEVFVAFCVQAGIVRDLEQQLKAGTMLKDDNGKAYVNPAAKDFRVQSMALLKMAVELGLSPRARQGVSITSDDRIKGNDKLSKLLNKGDGDQQ